MALIVHREPKVEISFDKNLVDEVGIEYTISCNVKGYPIVYPRIEFLINQLNNYFENSQNKMGIRAPAKKQGGRGRKKMKHRF